MPLDELREAGRELVGLEGEVWNGSGSLQDALEWARGSAGLTVVAGSLYLVADLFRLAP